MSAFIDFLRTGELGIIRIGQTQDNIEKYLGVPEAVSYNKSFVTLKYGCLQLSFYKVMEVNLEKQILKHIHMDFDNSANFPAILNLSGWYPTPDTAYCEFAAKAKEYGVNLYEDKQHTFKDIQVGFKSDSDVVIIFDDEGEDNKIVSMSLFKI